MNALRAAILAIVIFALGFCSTASAQFVIGRYAGEFMSLGAGARALAMGGASVAAPTQSTAGYYNPSALAGLEKKYVEFMHASYFKNEFTYDYLSFARPMPGGYGGALTVLYTRVGDIALTKTLDPNAPLSDANRVVQSGTTGDHELALIAAGGKQFASKWKAGAAAKLLYKTVAGKTAAGLGFDLGISRSIGKSLDVGVAAHDVTTSILAWSTGRTEAILPSLLLGGAWQTELRPLNAKVTVAADLEGHFESRGKAESVEAGPLSADPHVGVEYLIANTLALRGGVSGKTVTAGAGLRLSWLNVNAAFQDHSDLGLTHRVSLAVVW